MTFEEMQNVIERMLEVQRELHESQLRQQEGQFQQRKVIQSMQRNLQQRLEVQRDIQNSQLRQREEIDRLVRVADRLPKCLAPIGNEFNL